MPSAFGATLRRFRRKYGLSQEALAERADLSSQAVSALECGLRRSPHRTTVAQLAAALGLDEREQVEFEEAARRSRADEVRIDLPLPPKTFLGRSEQSATVARLLATHQLVTITGPGGIGKTSAALATAHVAAHRFEHGASFCDASPIRDEGRLAAAVAAACGLAVGRDPTSFDAVAKAIGASSRLIVLDNCEHIVDAAAALLRHVLARCPGLVVLATSRRRLAVPSEAVFTLPALDVPGPTAAARLTAAKAMAFSAVALFAARASMVDARFVLSDENAPSIARICRRLDGIPLAIELAAAHVRLMSPRELEQHLERFASRLQDDRRDGHARHRALRAAFDWSYDALDERQRRLFRAIGTFASSATLEAVTFVGAEPQENEADIVDLLGALVDASLVAVKRGNAPTRYRLLETSRDYARECAAAAGETDAWAARHLAHLRATFGRTTLTHDLENVRSALTWALHGDVVAGADLATRVASFWPVLGSAAEGSAWIRAFLTALPPQESGAAIRLMIAASFVERSAGQGDAGLSAATEALDRAKRAGEATLVFDALRSMAVSYAFLGRFAEAEGSLTEAAAAAEDPVLEMAGLMTHAWVARRRGSHRQAVDAFGQARMLARRLGIRGSEVEAAINAAETDHEFGHTKEALALLQSVLSDARLRGVDDENVLANVAGYAVACGDEAALAASARELLLSDGDRARTAPSISFVAMLEHVALACSGANVERASLLLGYCDAWYRGAEISRDVTERRTHERLLAVVRERFPPDTLAARLAEGAALDADDAANLALDALPR